MALPALADLAALAARLGPLSAPQRTRAEALLNDISTEVRQVSERTWTLPNGTLDPARPDVLAVVTLRAAERNMRNPSNLAGETVGDYTRRFHEPASDEDVYLTDGEKRMLLAALDGGGDLVSVPTERDVRLSDAPATVWVRDQHGGDLIPFDAGWRRW